MTNECYSISWKTTFPDTKIVEAWDILLSDYSWIRRELEKFRGRKVEITVEILE